MNHQPYDTWLFDDNDLTVEQYRSLQQHLAQCPSCWQLQQSWKDMRQTMRRLPQAKPQKGFTQRWRMNIESRKAMRQRSQLWKFFLSLTALAFITLTLAAYQAVSSGPPVEWLVSTLGGSVEWIAWLQKFSAYLFKWLLSAPSAVLILIALTVSSSLILVGIGWAYALIRIYQQGVYHK